MNVNQNRRNFLKSAALGSFGLLAAGQVLSACSSKATGEGETTDSTAVAETPKVSTEPVGIQLYTVRDGMTQDLAGSLKKVAEIGYKNLELAGYGDGKFYSKTPEEFKKMVSDLGMQVISSHTGVEVKGVDMTNAKILAEAHAKLGVKYCVQPWVVEEKRKTISSYKKMVGEFNKIGEVMKSFGIQFGYHNHDFEFATVEGKIPYYDVYMKEADPELITFEIDMYWATKAGQDLQKMFQDYPGRFQLWHLKDMDNTAEKYFAPVGAGTINFKEIFTSREVAGMKYFFVEQDNTKDGKPFDAIKISYDNIVSKILM